ncbi:MAG: signal recognition particle-docking protein FtsY [Treponema sp.]|jgi:fused signal recognition particle receptor|nr:signal recognition particle-docking protein FtsY [Treponema sp.]
MAKQSFADKLKNLFRLHAEKNESFFDDLTDALIEGDLGAKTAYEIIGELEKTCRQNRISDEKAIIAALRDALLQNVRAITLRPEPGRTSIYLALGVNGVGKTTTIAKLARLFRDGGTQNVVIAAADTFRAAAIEQLKIHGGRLGIRVVAQQHGSDPSAVVYDAAESASSLGGGLVLADTAGRLHNKENLVRELQKIDRVASSRASPGCYKKILVLDSTTGQNALRQAEVFHQAVGVDAVVMTKYDSTARGGGAFSIGRELGIPVAWVCFGEQYGDIRAFDPWQYTGEFLGIV